MDANKFYDGPAPEGLAQESSPGAGASQQQDDGLAKFYDGKEAQALADRHDAWAEELEADPDFGGEKLAGNVEAARRVLREHGGEDVVKDLKALGLQNLPSLVRFLARIDRRRGGG